MPVPSNSKPDRKKAAHQWGLDAEAKAAHFLRGLGYTILAERYRSMAGEIDLLAFHDETLIIVEVKARQSHDDALWSVTPTKQKRLAQAANAVLMEADKFTGLGDPARLNIRFDVIVITPEMPPAHLQNAWSVDF